MSVYKRKPLEFNARLAHRADYLARRRAELHQKTTVTVLATGQVTIALFPELTFPTERSARQFIARIIRNWGEE